MGKTQVYLFSRLRRKRGFAVKIEFMTLSASPESVARRAGRISLLVGIVLLAVKFSAYVATESVAVLSDAAESLVNVGAALMLIWALRIAAIPADADHPYGHGKIESFSAGVEGALIFIVALGLIYEALSALWIGPQVRNVDLALLAVVGAGAGNAALGIYLLRAGRAAGSLALEADGRHVLADAWTSGGAAAGLAAVWLTGWTVLDPLAALAVAAHLLAQGAGIVKRAVDNLMDAASPELLRELAARLTRAREDSWIEIHDLRAWRSGAALHADLHVVAPRYYNAEQLHDLHGRVKDALLCGERAGGAVAHFDPCRPSHCPQCAMRECPVRAAEFRGRQELTAENIVLSPLRRGEKSAAKA